jgi:hypothetical protein
MSSRHLKFRIRRLHYANQCAPPCLRGLGQTETARSRLTSSRATGAIGHHPLQFRGDTLQFVTAIPDVSKGLPCDGVDLRAGEHRVVVQAQQASSLVETEAWVACTSDEAEPRDLPGTQRPVSAGRTGAKRYPDFVIGAATGLHVIKESLEIFRDAGQARRERFAPVK